MQLKYYHFYNPYKEPTLGFVWEDSKTIGNETIGQLVEDIDFYYQPLEPPGIAILFFFVRLTIIFFGEIIGKKVVIMTRQETGILSEITLMFIAIQMIFHPILIFFELAVNLMHPIEEIIGPWICTVGWLFYNVSTTIVLNYSFFAAVMRYVFVVHEDGVGRYGKEKVRRHFLYLYLATTIARIGMKAVDGTSRLSFINKCYGRDHEIFLIETSSLGVLKRKFWTSIQNQDQTMLDFLFHVIKRIIKILDTMIFLALGFNLTEVIVYRKIFSHLDR